LSNLFSFLPVFFISCIFLPYFLPLYPSFLPYLILSFIYSCFISFVFTSLIFFLL
jgi:hypothetical protein